MADYACISDMPQRSRYLNAQNTINELLDMGVIPIVNENDTLAVSEIKFGDNDTLSAITAAMVHADLLFLMTDVDCLYDKNPRTNPDAQPIEVIDDISVLVADGNTPFPLSPANQHTLTPLQSPKPAPPSAQAACRPKSSPRASPPRPASPR